MPDPLNAMPRLPNPGGRLRAGCYVVCFTPYRPYPDEPDTLQYEGTLRVEHRNKRNETVSSNGEYIVASGDLYAQRGDTGVLDDPSGIIPILPRGDYRFYFLVKDIPAESIGANGFTLRVESHGFHHDNYSDPWKDEGDFDVRLEWKNAPAGFPSAYDYLTGEVRDSFGSRIGAVTLAWVSDFLRRAIVEIDEVQGVPCPRQYGDNSDVTWESVFKDAGWDLKVEPSDTIEEPYGQSWTEDALLDAMLTLRDAFDLDHEWRYYILCVSNMTWFGRGIMFDSSGGDFQKHMFETVVVAGDWQFSSDGNTEQLWGLVAGELLKNTPLYFRTAVHEIGHAMNLEHNFRDNGFMNTTDTIARNALSGDFGSAIEELLSRSGVPQTEREEKVRVLNAAFRKVQPEFPANVKTAFAPDDKDRLRHWPDIVVRPGSPIDNKLLPGASASIFQDESQDEPAQVEAEKFELKASPLEADTPVVPIGAPVRINLELINKSATQQRVPESGLLSLKDGDLHGRVIDPEGKEFTFAPLIQSENDGMLRVLESGESVTGSITLLRGPDGALFPRPGIYRIVAELSWFTGLSEIQLDAETTITVTPPVDPDHQKVADRLIHTPDTLLSLAIGGEILSEGNQAINAALINPVLRPHFAIVELKRLIRGFGRDKSAPMRFVDLLSEKVKVVLSPSEILRLAALIGESDISKADINELAELIFIGAVSPEKLKGIAGAIRKKFSEHQLKELASMIPSRKMKTSKKLDRLAEVIRSGGFTPSQTGRIAEFFLEAKFSDEDLAKLAEFVVSDFEEDARAQRIAELFHQRSISVEKLKRVTDVFRSAKFDETSIVTAAQTVVDTMHRDKERGPIVAASCKSANIQVNYSCAPDGADPVEPASIPESNALGNDPKKPDAHVKIKIIKDTKKTEPASEGPLDVHRH